MKTVIIVALVLLFSGCSAKKTAGVVVTPDCPPDGKCTIEILYNKGLDVKTDEFGSLYYQIRDDRQTAVVLYKYEKDTQPDLADAGYREEIIFEISNTDGSLELTGKQLQQTKMLFGRFCFCRGQTGNYKVEQGSLNLKKEGKTVQFHLDFTIAQVPQVLRSVEGTLK